MIVKSWIWIGDTKYDFTNMEYEKKKDCVMKIKMQIIRSQGRKPKDWWLKENPRYAEYWEQL